MSELVAPADDFPHRPGGGRWQEEWWFDFATADASLGGFLRLATRPSHAVFWAALVGDGRPYLLVRDESVPLPRSATPEIRAEALWSALECETPLEHWTVGLEAFAVEMDDPFEAWRGERGDRVGLGFDLEWEASGPATADGGGFFQSCEVHGEILVGPDERMTVAAVGWRRRSWGEGQAPPRLPRDDGHAVRHVAPLLADGAPLQLELTARPGWRLGSV